MTSCAVMLICVVVTSSCVSAASGPAGPGTSKQAQACVSGLDSASGLGRGLRRPPRLASRRPLGPVVSDSRPEPRLASVCRRRLRPRRVGLGPRLGASAAGASVASRPSLGRLGELRSLGGRSLGGRAAPRRGRVRGLGRGLGALGGGTGGLGGRGVSVAASPPVAVTAASSAWPASSSRSHSGSGSSAPSSAPVSASPCGRRSGPSGRRRRRRPRRGSAARRRGSRRRCPGSGSRPRRGRSWCRGCR